MMPVELGVLIPTREAIMSGRPETGPLLTMAERAEAAGFDSVWVGDSITARPRHEPLTLMAGIAARTRRVRIGTGVLLPALRNPVVLAHVVGTLDRIAEGRIILGVGIAADTPAIRREFAATGVPWDSAWGASSRRSRSAARCGPATASASAASTSPSRT
jgi:alkanesulfonate monooxygenase SsuD/methylene tetrahydromethanopterin reductase-like flavin-dependent oxidoreductase (luciferase family)